MPLVVPIVPRVLTLLARGCGHASANSPLRGTHWTLVRLGQAPVAVSAGQAEPQLVFASDALQVSGSGGCNRITGSFTLEGDRLRLGPLAGTMMACVKGMDQEQRLRPSRRSDARMRARGRRCLA